jgi:hypothetical protein
MTPPPTSIDGTDITGATIDGQEVQEITVDGQTVFTASNLAVSNGLQARFPFQNDLKDATGNFTSSATGVTLQSSGGVTDPNEGANSGFADSSGNGTITMNDGGEFMTRTNRGLPWTIMGWFEWETTGDPYYLAIGNVNEFRNSAGLYLRPDGNQIFVTDNDNGTELERGFSQVNRSNGAWIHVCGSNDGGTGLRLYLDGTLVATGVGFSGSGAQYTGDTIIGHDGTVRAGVEKMDDVRFYNRQLADSEVQDIYQNTEP